MCYGITDHNVTDCDTYQIILLWHVTFFISAGSWDAEMICKRWNKTRISIKIIS